ncbi:hypothetical protein [Sphingomonas sp. ERG5]|uniref:hypothetical protein n=1 Tax=Sphingomonas sp. ERG5 TaxID=1381597 RepID=UPI00054C0308|nr:hypothetical protein [Sphingomonas sp. ERG5]
MGGTALALVPVPAAAAGQDKIVLLDDMIDHTPKPITPKCEMHIWPTDKFGVTVDSGSTGLLGFILVANLHGKRKGQYSSAMPVSLAKARQVELMSRFDLARLKGMVDPLIVFNGDTLLDSETSFYRNQSKTMKQPSPGTMCRGDITVNAVNLKSISTETALTVSLSYRAVGEDGKKLKDIDDKIDVHLTLYKDNRPDIEMRRDAELVGSFMGAFGQFLNKHDH